MVAIGKFLWVSQQIRGIQMARGFQAGNLGLTFFAAIGEHHCIIPSALQHSVIRLRIQMDSNALLFLYLND